MIELNISEPNKRDRTLTIQRSVAVIGRSSRADIRFSNDAVSSRHAILKVYSDGCVIEDQGSSNGTFVNGQRIAVPVDCPNGTRIQLGSTGPSIEVLSGSAAPVPQEEVSVVARDGGANKSTWAIWTAGGATVVLMMLVGVCGAGALITSAIKALPVVSESSGSAEPNDAVALIFCGWRITSAAGVKKDQPAVINSVGADGKIDADKQDYVSRFVENGTLKKIPGKERVHIVEVLLGSTGSGFPVTDDGYIITNKHVVDDAAKLLRAADKVKRICEMNGYSEAIPTIWAFINGEPYVTDLIHISEKYDLAIIKSAEPTPTHYALSKSQNIGRGTQVSAVGFPGAVRDVNKGVTALLGMDAERLGASGTVKGFLSQADLNYYQTFGQVSSQSTLGSVEVIYHGAKINSGNSGGPLVDNRGVVRGVNTWGVDSADVNASQVIGQMRNEIDLHIPKVNWVK